MNDDFEQRLAALQPAELPTDLRTRLDAPPASRGKIRWLWVAAPLAAAACWLLAPAVQRPAEVPIRPARRAQPADYHVYLPISQTSTLVSVEDLAVIDGQRADPIRLVRAVWVDDVIYTGDDGRSTLRRQEPRAAIIPVALETY